MKCWFILTSWLGKPQHLTWQFCLKHWWKLCQKCYVGICTLTFMFKSGRKAARLGPQEIILFILQSQAGSAGLKLYLSGIWYFFNFPTCLWWTSQNVLGQSSWTLNALSAGTLFPAPAPASLPATRAQCSLWYRVQTGIPVLHFSML